jgi:cyclopropane-fatty-acyl-phospholipid synthase
MWKYFLLSSAGAFRARRNQVWQIVFTGGGLTGGYASVR